VTADVAAGAYATAVELELTDVSYSFETGSRRGTGGKAAPVLSGIDLVVHRSEFVTIMGPSGCGKSTLINIVAGFLQPSGGRVRCGESDVTHPGADRGVVAQHPALFPWMTVLENVLFGPGARGHRGRRQAIGDARRLIEEVGLGGYEQKRPYELSGGMQHRAAIARTIANRPRLLLMDEPFASLDAQTRVEMQEWLLSLWDAHRFTVLFVTHDIEEGLLLSDRVLVMSRQGQIQREVVVSIPRPRDESTVLEPEFVEMRREVRALMRSPSATAA
jgi:NitT/TauT family transport system ATP-binding protein